MRQLILCIALVTTGIFNADSAFAQDYKTGIGLRGGWLGGLTAKHFVKDGRAIEGILSSGWGWRGYQFTALYEIHKAAFTKDDVKGFFWFYGGGLHFGRYPYKKYYSEWHPTQGNTGYYTYYHDNYNYSTFGIDGIFGLEYKIDEVPITLSLDVKPFIEFVTYGDYPVRFWDGGFSIRYVFGGGKEK